MTLPQTNPSWTIPSHASTTSDLTKTNLPIPTPGPNQVLLKLVAASLNYRDLLITTHSPRYPGTHKHNLIPCSDGSGLIHSTGRSSRWRGKENTLVIIHQNGWLTGAFRNWITETIIGGIEIDGTLTSWMVVDDEVVIEAPRGLSGVEASAVLTAGGTAWAAVRGWLDGRLDGELGFWEGGWGNRRAEGKWVLTQGTGGVSCFAIQIAAALGATVIATSSSDEKLEIAKKLGAKYTINYKTTPDWEEEVLRITGGRGVDHVIEVGGAQTLLKSLKCTAPGGLVSLIGILSDADPIPGELVPTILYAGRTVKGIMAFNRDHSAEFARFVEAHGIKPVIAKVFEFEQAVEAMDALEKQNDVGKLVIKISSE